MPKSKKYWYMQFDINAWENDPALNRCSMSTRGIWSLILCQMYRDDRSGTIAGTVVELARIVRCTPEEMTTAINELKATGTADILLHCNANVTGSNTSVTSNVTIICRRMKREYKARKGIALRVASHRQKRECNANVTAHIKSNSNSNSNIYTPLPPLEHAPELSGLELPKRDKKAGQEVDETGIGTKAIQHVQTQWGIAESEAGRINNTRLPGTWKRRENENCIQRTAEEQGLDFILQIEPWVFPVVRRISSERKIGFGWGTVAWYLTTPEFHAEKTKRERMSSRVKTSIQPEPPKKPDTTLEDFKKLPADEQRLWIEKAKEIPGKHSSKNLERLAAGSWKLSFKEQPAESTKAR